MERWNDDTNDPQFNCVRLYLIFDAQLQFIRSFILYVDSSYLINEIKISVLTVPFSKRLQKAKTLFIAVSSVSTL